MHGDSPTSETASPPIGSPSAAVVYRPVGAAPSIQEPKDSAPTEFGDSVEGILNYFYYFHTLPQRHLERLRICSIRFK